MAFSAVTERGSAATKSSATTLAVSPSANLTVGKIVFAQCASDNFATTSGATTEHTSVTDTHGHTWTKVFERTRTAAGAVNDGITHSLWWTKIITQIGTGDSVTLTIANARNVRVIALFEVSITGSTIQLADDGTPAAFDETAGTSATASTSGMTSQEYLHLGLLGREADVLAWTEDADYTNVYAAEGISSTGGGAATNQSVFAAYRIATLTGDTFAVSWTGATDVSLALVAFEEVSGAGPQNLTGSLFTSTATFGVGVVDQPPAEQPLTGTLFTAAATFSAGNVTSVYPLTGTLFSSTATFPQGTVDLAGTVTVSGVLYVNTATFFTGTVTPGAVALTGTLHVSTSTFFAGVVSTAGATQNLTGTLHTSTSAFFAGRVARAVPTGLTTDEIGVMGHSIPGTFIDYYRTISAQDLVTGINHGGINARTWGNPADPGYAAAWAKLDDDEPVGGFRAFWVMLGFATVTESTATIEGWVDHIISRLLTDFPTIEYLWWSPQATYFSTNPGDGDAEDLVAIDRWGANPLGLTEHASAAAGEVAASEKSWTAAKYAVLNGADDYGPWINLVEEYTGPDGRHPSEVADGDPIPNGQSHGGDLLLAFFEGGAQGMAGTLLTVTPTFFTGTMTTGPVALTGTLFTSTPTFPQGILALAGTTVITGTLFVSTATFPTGAMSTGPVALTGTLFVSTSSFPAGQIDAATSLDGSLFVSAVSFPAGTVTTEATIDGTLFTSAPIFFTGILAPAGGLFGTLYVNTPTFFTGILTVALPSFWTVNPVGYTVNPVAYVKVGAAGPSPWGATLSGDRLEVAPLFPVGSVN